MITLKTSQQPFWDTCVDARLFLMKSNLNGEGDQETLDYIEQHIYPHIRTVLEKYTFNGKREESIIVPWIHNDHVTHLIFLGLGCLKKRSDQELENARRTIARAIPLIKKYKATETILKIPPYLSKITACSSDELCQQLGIASIMASYEFNNFKTIKKNEPHESSLIFDLEGLDLKKCSQAIETAQIIGKAINQAREWADTPGNIMTPTALSLEAQKIADKRNLSCTIFGKEKAEELGMGSFLSVDQGTIKDGKFVILEYKGAQEHSPTIALCGKGIMFDTGGISLKPSSYMDGMKFDMCGAAAVIATMDIISQLKPACSVIAVTPLTENMPSGSASRQDDIVTAMNGKTIEIKNTDAEGRLVLADALCYAEKTYNPDVIIDVATLTGACLYALGHFYTAVMTRDEDLAQTLIHIGKKTGDRMWELPLDDDFVKANNSEVADVNNSGSRAYLAGTIIGACFLENFVEKARWAHLDIAGTSHEVPGINYMGKGASGAGIRALVEFIMNFDTNKKTEPSCKESCK